MASERSPNVYGGPPPLSDLRLLLLGRVGAGKSTVAKTILGRENFRSEGGMCVKKQGEVAGRTVTVVDTPGWDTVKYTSTHIKQEIKNSVTLCPPGPHALLLVVPMGDPLSSAERKAIRYHMELLSVRAWKFTMVLFVSEAEEKCTSIEQNQMIDRAKSILVKCGDRHHLLECGHSPQISELLKKIDAMVAENCEEFLIPQVYYELMETMPREVTELRRMYEDREDRLKQKYKTELKEKEEELKKYREEEKPKERLMKRTSSSQLLPPSISTEKQDGSVMADHQKVDLQAVKQGYREEALSVVGHYVKPLIVIMTAVVGALMGAVAGAEHGTLGACTGIPIGIILAVLVSYAVRGAATAARDISITVKAEENESQRRAERAGFFLDSPKSKRFDKDQ
ncbi:GTPase IMAP family member 4 [Oncorhynchus kisutch]|uniref:GTPase IMAP family member 4 n=1 Tax=Oncorhynchus kisutch TaxID=8019 RepID=UPI0009A00004|nr:GTPase IMAP family member 4 [Oncorhynchus kisutch]XP_020333170.1 GTPase IMAP family member 4 [Oncorhynchus kisutch]XP_031687865.1 GTPase IMAP family member 4 [Oncorhynchus kisutch]